MASETLSSQSTAEKVQTLFQAVLSFAAVVYAVGFIVVNTNYTTFGVADYDLVQTRYIAAGLNYLLMHASLAGLVAIIMFVLKKPSTILWIMVFVGLWVLLGSEVYLQSGSISKPLFVGVNAGIITLVGLVIWATLKNVLIDGYKNLQETTKLPRQMLAAYLGVFVLALGITGAITWGLSFWSTMSETLGGGRPNQAVFVLDTKDWSEASSAFIPMQTESVSKQLPILFENPDEYIVLVDGIGEGLVAASLPKSIVYSAIFAPSKFMGYKEALPTLVLASETPTITPQVTPSPSSTVTPPEPTQTLAPSTTETPTKSVTLPASTSTSSDVP